MVSSVLHRLGMVGAILIATALIFGAIAGGVIVHRLQAAPTASSEQQQGDHADGPNAGGHPRKAPRRQRATTRTRANNRERRGTSSKTRTLDI
ncbi:MAG TPA: hypothetical protein VHJ99_01115 [Candidatus Dormibacteraeota bacterium]|nr:hypothetical protein [Candidatus Dormibacteraeota bacterium]